MKTRRMILCALFAALTAICAQIVIPMGTVPMNLALLPILISGALLPVRYALAAALVYIGMGAAGLPVFAGMAGGPGILLGPTGGYILGYGLCTAVTALLISKGMKPPVAMTAGVLACYALGTAWLAVSAGLSLPQALLSGVIPFMMGDILKVFSASYLAKRLYLVVRP